MENKIQVLIRIDSRNLLTAINSSIFISDLTDWIVIDEGLGDKYAHAQGNYLPLSLIDGQGNYNYIYKDGVVEALTDSEKATLFPTQIPQPSEMEILGQRITDTELDAMESNQRITDLELCQLEGGASNV